MLPPGALLYISLLFAIQVEVFPDLHQPHLMAGQIEQETCISLKHSKCWSPHAELKTSREYGFGLGQITVTDRFNNFEIIKQMDSQLKTWEWSDRYNPQLQLRALVVYNRHIYSSVKSLTNDPVDRIAFMYCAYNGGIGGLIKDRNICKGIVGCDPSKWFGNVEKHTYRNTKPVEGYKKSFFDINREYVYNILKIRGPRYKEEWNNVQQATMDRDSVVDSPVPGSGGSLPVVIVEERNATETSNGTSSGKVPLGRGCAQNTANSARQ